MAGMKIGRIQTASNKGIDGLKEGRALIPDTRGAGRSSSWWEDSQGSEQLPSDCVCHQGGRRFGQVGGQNQADRLEIGKQGGCSKDKGPGREWTGVENQEIGKLGIVFSTCNSISWESEAGEY